MSQKYSIDHETERDFLNIADVLLDLLDDDTFIEVLDKSHICRNEAEEFIEVLEHYAALIEESEEE